MSTTFRRLLQTTARWGFAAVVFVITLEVAIRVDDRLRWGGPLLRAYSHSALFGVDSVGWRPRPGARFEKWEINQHGFRGPEVDLTPEPGTVRIAVLGASETFGQSESPGHEYPRLLERRLNEQISSGLTGIHRFEVINAGVPGMSLGRIREYWNDWVIRFEPDIVVVYPSPGFYLGNTPPAGENPRAERRASLPADKPRLPGKLRMVLNRFIPETVEAHLKRLQIEYERNRHAKRWEWDEVPMERVALFERHYRALVSDLQQSGVTTVLATHARAVDSTSQDNWATVIGWQKYHPRADGHVILEFEDVVNEIIVRIGEKRGLAVARVNRAVPPGPKYFSDHQHFTDAGAELAAEAIASAILQELPYGPALRPTGSR